MLQYLLLFLGTNTLSWNTSPQTIYPKHSVLPISIRYVFYVALKSDAPLKTLLTLSHVGAYQNQGLSEAAPSPMKLLGISLARGDFIPLIFHICLSFGRQTAYFNYSSPHIVLCLNIVNYKSFDDENSEALFFVSCILFLSLLYFIFPYILHMPELHL